MHEGKDGIDASRDMAGALTSAFPFVQAQTARQGAICTSCRARCGLQPVPPVRS